MEAELMLLRYIRRFAIIAVSGLALLSLSSSVRAQQAAGKPHVPDQIDYSMFFEADIRDTPECAAKVANGKIVFGDVVSNPAMSCPDAFGWKLFVEAVKDGFWENWASDREIFPSDPWPRCLPGQAGNCCPAVATSNDAWPQHCPVFPGATPGVPDHMVQIPGKAHLTALSAVAAVKGAGKWEDVPAVLKNAVIGAVQNELVYRNEPMVNYVFGGELYYAEGLGRVYDNFVRAISAYAPRWPQPSNPAGSYAATPSLVSINLPISSVMVKANWLAADQAPTYGIDPYDTKNPFIIMDLVPQSNDNAPPADGKPAQKKPYILLSLHISSKAVPNWTWATFEHVANQGRCDWTGCNDSFGYADTQTPQIDQAPAAGLATPANNFTPPHAVKTIDGAQQQAFDLAKRYLDNDRISSQLDAIFKSFEIGSGSDINRSGRPTVQDAGWRSYRLKGSQTNFVTATGRTSRLGNSVTEAGFVNSASCITCHARAGATKEGVPPLSIFADSLSDAGIPKSVNGPPNEAWFNVNAFYGVQGEREAPGIHAIPTDFVWGFRLACPTRQTTIGPKWCANVISRK
jgi:hypothetical protein